MNADTTNASPASWTSTSQVWRSTKRSTAAYITVSANVRPMRKKNGSTANDPGAVIRANVAVPSSSVLMTSRMAMSQRTLTRKSVAGGVMRSRSETLHHGGHGGHRGENL